VKIEQKQKNKITVNKCFHLTHLYNEFSLVLCKTFLLSGDTL